MIKVLMVNKLYPPWIGGVENHLYTLCQELKEYVELKVLVANTGLKTEIEYRDGYKVVRAASLGIALSTPLCINLYFWLTHLKSDIIHFHFPYPIAEVVHMLTRSRSRVVVTYHSDIVRQKRLLALYKPFLIKFLSRADLIIASSPNMIEHSPYLNRFKKKCVVIPYGIDIKRFRLTPEVEKKAGEIKKRYNSPLVLFVGRLIYYKGLQYLIRAMEKVDARLLIIGRGREERDMKKLAWALGMSEKTVFLGEVNDADLVPYYYASDIFVLPSVERTEAFGIVQIEAQACGLPVVSAELSTGVTFANLNGITGMVVPPRSSERLSDAINKLLKDTQLRKNMGKQGRKRVESEFTKEIMAQKTLSLYKGLMI